MHLLAFLTLILSAADHWTTYVCLRSPVSGWQVTEANPISEWLFGWIGLVPGLLVDSAITLFAVAFLLTTRRLPGALKGTFFAAVVVSTGYAVINNLRAIEALGISPVELG